MSEVTAQFEQLKLSDEGEKQLAFFKSIGKVSDEKILQQRLATNKPLIILDGYEASSRMTVAQGLVRALLASQMLKQGHRFIFMIGDWYAQMNNKLDGDLKKIQNIGKFMIENWKAVPNVDLSKAEFIFASEMINKQASDYWIQTLDIARRCKLKHVTACAEVMGVRMPTVEEQENNEEGIGKLFQASQIFYPCMQLADLFFLKVDVCQMGENQQAIEGLAHAYLSQVEGKQLPAFVFHPLLSATCGGGKRMTAADPTTALFMDDSAQDINTKLKKAFCEPKNIDNNPVLEYAKLLILPFLNQVEVKRDAKNGGDKTYTTIQELQEDFASGALHPGDLKAAVSAGINKVLDSVRDKMKGSKALVDTVKKYWK